MTNLSRRLLSEWRANARRWQKAVELWHPKGVEVFNPGIYACDLYARFLACYPPGPHPIITLGLNPGPFGMAQTGIPFTDCRTAAAILDIKLPIPGRAPPALIRRLRKPGGRWRGYYERSSIGIYRLLRLAWGDLGAAYRNWTVTNTCPLLFLKAGDYKNMTPADGPLRRLEGFQRLRVTALERFCALLDPRGIVCLGKDVSAAHGEAAERLVGARRVIHYPHPARAVPAAWAEGLRLELARRRLI